MMMMTCGRARRLLWPDAGPRKVTREIEQARAHVSGCELCKRFLEDMRVMAERIRLGVARQEAPADVRNRLFEALARARTVPPGRWPAGRRIAMGLSAALLAAAAWVGVAMLRQRGDSAGQSLGVLTEEHRRTLGSYGVMSSDSSQVAAWLATRLSFAVEVPLFPGAQLKGARLFVVGQRTGAIMEYALDGRALSYYVFPALEPVSAEPRDIRVTSRNGYRIAVWQEPGIEHALVGDLSADTILALARYCMRQMLAQGHAMRHARG